MSIETLLALGKIRKAHTFECGGLTIHYRGLSNRERIEYRDYALDEKTAVISDNFLIATALCKPDGTPLYEGGARFEAMDAISDLDPVLICKPLIKKILLASGIGKEAEDVIAKN